MHLRHINHHDSTLHHNIKNKISILIITLEQFSNDLDKFFFTKEEIEGDNAYEYWDEKYNNHINLQQSCSNLKLMNAEASLKKMYKCWPDLAAEIKTNSLIKVNFKIHNCLREISDLLELYTPEQDAKKIKTAHQNSSHLSPPNFASSFFISEDEARKREQEDLEDAIALSMNQTPPSHRHNHSDEGMETMNTVVVDHEQHSIFKTNSIINNFFRPMRAATSFTLFGLGGCFDSRGLEVPGVRKEDEEESLIFTNSAIVFKRV